MTKHGYRNNRGTHRQRYPLVAVSSIDRSRPSAPAMVHSVKLPWYFKSVYSVACSILCRKTRRTGQLAIPGLFSFEKRQSVHLFSISRAKAQGSTFLCKDAHGSKSSVEPHRRLTAHSSGPRPVCSVPASPLLLSTA